LTDTTGVAFNGTSADFRVISSTEILAAVPEGATTGKVTVTMPARKLKSNLPFTVTQQP
jgi:hypothetical protein